MRSAVLLGNSVRALFPDDSDPAFAARRFSMSIQATRLVECGFEAHINGYEPRELALLATQMPPQQRAILMIEARMRGLEMPHGQ